MRKHVIVHFPPRLKSTTVYYHSHRRSLSTTLTTNPTPTWVSSNSIFQRHPRLQSLHKCKSLRDFHLLHCYTIISGLINNPFVAGRVLHVSLTTIHPPSLTYSYLMFTHMKQPNLFSWNTMIRAFGVEHERASNAFLLYDEMLRRRVLPDNHTYPFLLAACRSASYLNIGRMLHVHCLVMGFGSDKFVQTGLMNFYFICGHKEDARYMFDAMGSRDVVSWTGMISGLIYCGSFEEALLLFNDMRRDDSGPLPNVSTLVTAISACSCLGSMDHSRNLHGYTVKIGLVNDTFVANSLINAYAKCGNAVDALKIFRKMDAKDLHSWTAIITGLALHGFGHEALDVFSSMERSGVVPDPITFVAILSACSHSGLVEEGKRLFDSMLRNYNIVPEMKHYGCMIDLLSRAGLVQDAYEFVLRMPLEPNLEILGSLLSACRIQRDLLLGKTISEKIKLVCEEKGGSHVLLSNMYANVEQWDEVVNIRNQMRVEGRKPSGRSWIEVNGVVHEFVVGDKACWYDQNMYLVMDGWKKLL